ncbi:hypothetical protein ACHAXR_012765 [Thalassiosira sp. AJA248-18]
MSSKPKIIIAPKKKKKKSLIIVSSKNKKNDGVASSSSNSRTANATRRPTSPNTVVAAAATTTTDTSGGGGGGYNKASSHNKQKQRKSSGIFIKPFEKPPELPPDFYDTSLNILRRALTCVLRHEALTASPHESNNTAMAIDGNGDNNANQRLIGREELYRSVEDLCVHKFGSKLYYDVVKIMEGAAGEVVHRLAKANNQGTGGDNNENHGGELDAIVDSTTGDVGYNASTLINELNLKDGGVCSSSSGNFRNSMSSESDKEALSYSEKRYSLLKRLHATCRSSYAEEYLTFVRSIFLALDRAHVYLSDVELDEIGGSTTAASGLSSQRGLGGKVLERSSAGAFSNSSTRVWGLWEVGTACLREHMTPTMMTIKSLAPSDSGADAGTDNGGGTQLLPVLTTMVLTTAHAILSEYDTNRSDASGPVNITMSDIRPLVRNCVRTCIDLGALPTLLEELIIVATARFEKEGKWWSLALNSGGESSKSCTRNAAPEYLLHVEHRLRQGVGLTSYYLPSSVESGVALRGLAKLPFLTGVVPSSSSSSTESEEASKVVWSPSNHSTRRILPAIIEKQLLGPHLVPTGGILESRHLYPMLDDDDGSSSSSSSSTVGGGGGSSSGNSDAWKSHSGSSSKAYENAKRLYGLCWRMTMSSPTLQPVETAPSQPSGGSNATPLSKSALDHLRIAFGEYGRLRGAEIIKQGLTTTTTPATAATTATTTTITNNKEMEKKVIPDLLAFKNHLYSLHTIAFRSEESFGAMVRSILEDVLNGASYNDSDGDGGRRIAELLAKHVDARFKDAKAGAAATTTTNAMSGISMVTAAITTDANESFQSEILALFRHIHSKDVFEAFYKRDLAKRLLTGRSVSTDMERSFLSKLKAECGAGYTSKMEGMFKDMELSRDIMGSYSAYASGATTNAAAAAAASAVVPTTFGSSSKAVDMDVQVLTTGYWPVYPKYPNILLPPELLSLRTKFETYYNDKYQGRRIAWQYSLGNCIVKASFPKCPAPKELIVNMCQSLVLLCFRTMDGDDGRGLTLEDISKKTGIEDMSELGRVLQSLSMGRDGTRVLKRVPYDSPTVKVGPSPSKNKDGSPRKAKPKIKARKNVGPYDRFLFNEKFSSNQRRIRITNITMKETSEERTKTHDTVSKDRLYFIDAAVVRIMKARKTLDHRGLIGEVMAQLKFPTTSADIKKRIESLIEREYMERVEGDRSKYKYLA